MKRMLVAFALGLLVLGCRHEVRYSPPPPATPEKITDIKDAWVRLFDDPAFAGRSLTVRYPQDLPDMGQAVTDTGTRGFNDKAKSLKWQIPEGWEFVLYDDPDYKGGRFPLIGTGKVESLPGPIAGKISSGRWERK